MMFMQLGTSLPRIWDSNNFLDYSFPKARTHKVRVFLRMRAICIQVLGDIM